MFRPAASLVLVLLAWAASAHTQGAPRMTPAAPQAAARLSALGIDVVQDRCMMPEHRRLVR